MGLARSGHRATAFLTAFLFVPGLLPAQETADDREFSQALASSFQDAASKMVALAKATPAEAFAYRPTEEVRTMSELYMHVVGSNFHIPAACGIAPPDGINIPTGPYDLRVQRRGWEEDVRTKEAVVDLLELSFTYALAALPEIADLNAEISPFGFTASTLDHLFILLSHSHEHLGQAIAYARGAGVVPPWSRTPEQAHPASQATFGPEGVRAKIVAVDRFGNLVTNLVAKDLEKLELSVGDTVSFTACDQSVAVFLGDTVTDVSQGEWFAFLAPSGTLTVGRYYENAARTIGCAAGESILLHRQ